MLQKFRALIRLEDMEDHFSRVWCNFGPQDEFNQKILTDIKNFRASAKKAIFHRNCKPWDGRTVLPDQLLQEPGNPKDEHAARGTAAWAEAHFFGLAQARPGPSPTHFLMVGTASLGS